ncbi:MAG: aromatic ring-hydroxylating dioxygenase subunit alpha, partial [Pseudomonadota bacterium]
MASRVATMPNTDPDEGWTLPAWTYSDPEFFAVEMKRIIRRSWQIVCHVSDVTHIGDYHTLDYAGESVIAIRGDDGVVQAFTNVCRHRGSRLVDDAAGCAKRLVCPYHGWAYDLDGRLTGVPLKSSYPDLDLSRHGLVPVDLEIFQGFIFVRLEDDGGPSVAQMMAPCLTDLAPYRFEDLRALGRVTLRERRVNWKNIGDNYSDALHIAVAHPGLRRLVGQGYAVEAHPHIDRIVAPIANRLSNNPSERAYQTYLPPVAHLPKARQRLWTYIKLWPNFAFDIYPDQIDFMQWIPVSPTQTMIREIAYAIPDADMPGQWRREMRAARYLNWRINRQVNVEDSALVKRVQDGMASASFTVGPLSETEVALRHFNHKVRTLIPEARQHSAPAPGWSAGRTA